MLLLKTRIDSESRLLKTFRNSDTGSGSLNQLEFLINKIKDD